MNNSWIGIRVKKEDCEGKIVDDWNGRFRTLTVKFNDKEKENEKIVMSNVGEDPNPEELHKWFWYYENGDKWYQF
jgi:hypothetical protein